MAKQLINIGNIINDGAGDTLREGAIKVNNTLNEIYNSLGNGIDLILVLDPASTPVDGQVLQWNDVSKRFQFGEAGARGFTGPQGPQGIQGIQGIIGPQGIQGEKGDIGPRLSVRGAVISVENLPASNNEEGDIYIVTSSGDSYVWQDTPDGDSSFSWINIGPLKGPQGDQGPIGPQGDQGPIGPQGTSGLSVIGAVTLVEELPLFNNLQGDFWIVTSTGDGYLWSPSLTGDSGFEWVNLGPWQASPSSVLSFTTIAVSGQNSVLADSDSDTLTLIAGTGISITTDAGADTITITNTGGGGGGEVNQNAFSNIAVAGQSTVQADNATDTLTLAAGTGITITTNASTDTVTIASTGGAGATTFTQLSDSANATIDQIYLPAITALAVTNNGASSYRFDQYGTADNPTVYAINGTTIAFNLNVAGHPFLIQTSGGSNYNEGLIHVTTAGVVTTGSNAQGKTSGTLYWKIPTAISGNYRYICSIHGNMVGVITIKDFSAI